MITTATRDPIEWTTIGSTEGTSSNINTIPITTFNITITIATIRNIIDTTTFATITIELFNAMTGTTSVINAILIINIGAATLESEVKTIDNDHNNSNNTTNTNRDTRSSINTNNTFNGKYYSIN